VASSKKMIGSISLLKAISILIGLVAAILAIYGHCFEHPATKEDIYALNESIIEHINSKFPDYEFIPRCENFKKPIIKDGAVFIDKCSYLHRNYSFNEEGYAVDIRFRSSWFDSDDRVHYLFDIGNSEEENRISLYEENNYLKGRIFLEDNKEYLIKLNLKNINWKDDKLSDDWNNIEMAWDKNSGHILLEVNNMKVEDTIQELSFNLSNSQLFFGTDLNREAFAEGYYDYIYFRKYVFSEPAFSSAGPEESLI
jgi:hypothetical protein